MTFIFSVFICVYLCLSVAVFCWNDALFDRYAGKYELRPGFVLTVTREANSLMVQATGQGKFEVFPESDLKYFAKVTELTIAFVKGDDGKVSELILTQGGRDQHAKRIE